MLELNVKTLASGGLIERIHEEIQRAIGNICEPNTPAKKTRKVKMEMTIKPNEQRNMAEVSVLVSSTLCPAEPIETGIYIGMNPATGEVGASEVSASENPAQNLLPDIQPHMPTKIAKVVTLGGNNDA